MFINVPFILFLTTKSQKRYFQHIGKKKNAALFFLQEKWSSIFKKENRRGGDWFPIDLHPKHIRRSFGG